MFMRYISFLLLLTMITVGCAVSQAPEPFGAVPSHRQLLWHQMKYHAFIHFGPNTFTELEWGHGDESPDEFNPKELDCRQWAKTLKDAGLEGVVITAKHHDGFCLWPSEFSTHTVRESGWRAGQGDVLRELSDACKEYGLKFGIYISPWDRNHPTYFTDEYNQVFKNMLEEVLTNYGDVYYVFLDGAFSLGPDGRRQEYDWQGFTEVIRRCQPDAVIFSDGGPDVRWIGNERGYADDTNWCTVKKGLFYPGIPGVNDQLLKGHEDGQQWLPAEVDVSIRPGWFYHQQEDNKVKTVAELMDIWLNSVGKNTNLLLNIPPDPRGLINEVDVSRLIEFKNYRESAFGTNLAVDARITASNSRGEIYSAKKAGDNDPDTYWATEDKITTASLELTFDQAIEINALLLQEFIALGQRVKFFKVEALLGENYQEIAKGVTIGNRRILKFDTVNTSSIKVTFEAKACILISNLELYLIP